MKKQILFLIIALLQIGAKISITPHPPRWGQTATIKCDLSDRTPQISRTQPVVMLIVFHASKEPTVTKRLATTEKENHQWIVRIDIPDQTAFMDVFCIPLFHPGFTYAGFMLARSDGHPPKRAHAIAMTPTLFDPERVVETYLEHFHRERELYPGNVEVFADRWDLEQSLEKIFPGRKFFSEDRVKHDIQVIKRVKTEDDEKNYVLAYGWALLGEKDKSFMILRNMVEKFPQSVYTWMALQKVSYYYYSTNQLTPSDEDDLNAWTEKIMESYPASPWTRTELFYLWEKYPLSIIETGIHAALDDEPENPQPRYVLARAYLHHHTQLTRARQLIEEAIKLCLEGYYQIYNDLTLRNTKRFLKDAYLTAAQISLELNDRVSALAYARTAYALSKEFNTPDIRPLLVEARVFEQSGWLEQAESLYLLALSEGIENSDEQELDATQALTALKRLYQVRYGSLEGFDRYLKQHGNIPSPAESSTPDFTFRTLEGEEFSLSQFKGNVVVLNFWTTTCAPCVAEIPELNQLVSTYRDKKVVFLAISPEPEKSVRNFLNQHPFSYKQIADADEIVKTFGVNAYPTHIVIDGEGYIVARLEGGGHSVSERLKPVIEKALKTVSNQDE